jgi:Domain of unknown function (DUF5134)
MYGSAVVGWLLAGLGGASGGYCLTRLLQLVRSGAGHPGGRRVVGCEAAMGIGMGVMALPAANPVPLPYTPVLFAGVFGVVTAVALHSVWRMRHAGHAHHAVGAAAMVYMAVEAARGGHHGGAGVPALTGVLLAYFAAYALLNGPRLVAGASAGGGAACVAVPAGGSPGGASAGPLAAPAMTAACRVTMGIGMFAMLLTM